MCMEKEFYNPQEFLSSDYYKSCSRHSQHLVRVLFDKLIDANIEFLVKKRAHNDIILVLPTRANAGRDKNIITVWIHAGSIDVLILNLLPLTHIYTEEQIDDELIGKAKMKYAKLKLLH